MEVGLKMASTLSEWRDKAPKLNFEETELRLGLSGGGGGGGGGGGSQRETATTNNNTTTNNNSNGKRGYSEILDLKLNISSKEKTGTDSNEKAKILNKEKSLLTSSNYPAKPPAKAQVVGWPPVQSFRKNVVAIRKSNSTTEDDEESINDKINSNNNNASFVKVSMDGAPYLRKVDMKIYKSYQELSDALGKMFSSFTIGNCGSQGMMDFMNESKLMDLLNDSDFVPAYEDKDGDWMLVGDVPWEMFVKSCKRLRIMKGKEAIGLAPRAMEKCKNRS